MKRTLLPHSKDDGASIVNINIVIERTNSKTQECFVELDSEDTMKVVMSRYNSMLLESRAPRMGTRLITVDGCSQGGMMKDVFPRAACIVWDEKTGLAIRTVNDDMYTSGFRGFTTKEELFVLVKYTTEPDRVSSTLFG